MTPDPRYPLGRFQRPAHLPAVDRIALIERIASLPARLRALVEHADDTRLERRYRDGGWSVRQVVHHIADSHMNAYIRVKLALTETHPTIKPYDEAAWAELADSRLPVDPSLKILDCVHERWVVVWRTQPDAAFARTLLHPDSGEMNVGVVLALYAWHGDHHLAHVRAALA